MNRRRFVRGALATAAVAAVSPVLPLLLKSAPSLETSLSTLMTATHGFQAGDIIDILKMSNEIKWEWVEPYVVTHIHKNGDVRLTLLRERRRG